MQVELIPLSGCSLAPVQREWTELSSRATPAPYLTFGWLESWMAAYSPRNPQVIRITDDAREPVALGLVEELPFGRLRFAGAPVTPVRGILCARRAERAAWRALGEFIEHGPKHRTSLEASGLDTDACDLPRAIVTPLPWLRLALPDSFDDYLRGRSAEVRRNFRRKLRLAERNDASAVEIEPDAVAEALRMFVRLHTTRANAKGEVHPSIDGRLEQMLTRVALEVQPKLRVTAVSQGTKMLAVGVELEQDSQLWFYNAGFDPDAARLSPGLVLRLASVRGAIERGLESCDMGPGYYRYKQDMGGEPVDRARVSLSGRSALGRIEYLAQGVRRWARDVEWVRRGVEAGDRIRRRASSD